MKLNKFTTLITLGLILASCGGGSSSDSGVIIEGTLTEAGGAAHNTSLNLKHSSGQTIENVEVCALGECSTTDGEGQWGFGIQNKLAGGDIQFTIKGHGIDTQTVVSLPSSANSVFIDFKHVEGGLVNADHVTVDGETSHNEGGHSDE